ncbi:MAG: TonB-dependent receptor, partial [Asticcacaulis sp.]
MSSFEWLGRVKRAGKLGAVSVLAMTSGLWASQALAQAANAGAEDDVQTVVVTGYRASVERSLRIKKAESGFVDAITSEDIGKFPDLNLSESLQRVPGVTLNRNIHGEGRSINLRGLGETFTRVEVDGMSGLPNGTGGRFGVAQAGRAFNFEILASELFDKATIYKTPLPELTEGGLAGTVRLETPKPLAYKGFRAVANVMGGYSENTGKTDPRVSVLVSNNWNDQLGLSASLAYSKTGFETNTVEGGSWRPFSAVNTGAIKETDPTILKALIANGPRYYHYSDNRETLGGTFGLQYRASDTLMLSLDALYGTMDSKTRGLRDDMALESGLNAPLSATVEDGIITSGRFTGMQQRVGDNFIAIKENMGQIVARADWQPAEGWLIQPSLGFARREADRTWSLYSFRLSDKGVFDPGVVSYTRRGDILDFSSTATDFTKGAENFLFNVFIYRPTKDEITENQAKLDVTRSFDGVMRNVKFGLRYADTVKDRVGTQERLNVRSGVKNADVPNLSQVSSLVSFGVDGTTAPSSLLGVDEDKIRAVFYPYGTPVTGTAVTNFSGFGAQSTYRIQEKTFNGYVSSEFATDDFTIIGGLRYVRTQQISIGSTVANVNLPTQSITPVRYSETYSAFLPSLTAKWSLDRNLILRGAYSRTLTRPDYDALAPSETVRGIDASGGTGSKGNPNLKPYESDNFDIGVEYYFGKDGLLSASAFYKKMGGFIDTNTSVEQRSYPRQSDGVIVTGPITFTQPVNSVSASVEGLEFSGQSRLFFLPGLFSNLGVQANLTFTKSSADFAIANDVRKSGLPGLSRRSLNTTLYYSDEALDVRLSYAW